MGDGREQKKYLSGFRTYLFGFYLVTLAGGLGAALIGLVSSMDANSGKLAPTELELILLVLLVGALGSYIHAATSFASYVGNRRLGRSWVWWYILRPFIGSALALIFYFVVRGGFLQAGSDTTDLNLYGIAALAGLTGMFSKQATDKLRELFDNLFGTRTEREDKLTDTTAQQAENGESEDTSDSGASGASAASGDTDAASSEAGDTAAGEEATGAASEAQEKTARE